MKHLLILLLSINYIFCHPVNKFLQNLESSENINTIYIYKINNSKYCDNIIKSLTLPKVIIQDGLSMNFLNFPIYKPQMSIKYCFNREYMTILTADGENINRIFDNYDHFGGIYWFSRDKTLSIITDTSFKYSADILVGLHSNNFVNVILINYEGFPKSKTFETFELFPKFKIISKTKFEKQNVQNVEDHRIKVLCNRNFPFSYCFRNKDNKVVGIGKLFHVIYNFAQFINAKVNLTFQIQKNDYNEVWLSKYDFSTKMLATTLNSDLEIYPMNTEFYSNILENYDVFIIVTKANFIDSFLYTIKPFSVQLWILYLVYLLYGSCLVTFTFYIMKKIHIFGKYLIIF